MKRAAHGGRPLFSSRAFVPSGVRSCREYRETFRQIQQQYPEARFLWIDIEDQPDLVGDISVEDFPTLLIATGAGPRFFGPLTPQRDVLMRLIEAHQNDIDGAALPDHELSALVARLRAL